VSGQADLYFSIRRPYSYLGLQRLDRQLATLPVTLSIRPVLPLAVRRPELFSTPQARLAVRYLEMDCQRVAGQLDLPFRIWPRPDPIVQDMDSLAIAAEQPYIYRLTRLLQVAVESGEGYAFTRELSSLIWSGHTDDWHLGDHMTLAARRAGLDLDRMDEMASRDADRLDQAITENQLALFAAGHWGVPTVVYDGEPFFGQDRVDLFIWRVRQTDEDTRT